MESYIVLHPSILDLLPVLSGPSSLLTAHSPLSLCCLATFVLKMKTTSILLALAATLAPALAQSSSSSSTTSTTASGSSSTAPTTASSSSTSGAQSSILSSSSSSVQSTQSSSSLTSSSSTSSAASTTSAAPITVQSTGVFTYIGCYSDSVASRALTGYTLNGNSQETVESCASLCSGYAYFGVEYAQVSLFAVHITSLGSEICTRTGISGNFRL